MKKTLTLLAAVAAFAFNALGQISSNMSSDVQEISAPNVVKQRLDSIVLPTKNKQYFKYDTIGQNIQLISYVWQNDIAPHWLVGYKQDYTYNTNKQLASEAMYMFNAGTSIWSLYFMDKYTYNTNGKISEQIDSTLTSTQKFVYTYNPNGDISMVNVYIHNNNTWELFRKTEFTYNLYNQKIQARSYSLIDTNNTWFINSEDDYTYDSSGYLSFHYYYTWNSLTNMWSNIYKYEYLYNSNHQNYAQIIYYQELFNNMTYHEKYTYTYAPNGSLAECTHYNYDSSTQSWLNADKFKYNNNDNYNASDLILPLHLNSFIRPYNYDYKFNSMLTDLKNSSWNTTSNIWNTEQTTTYYYSPQEVTSVRGKAETVASVYPVPAKEVLNIVLGGDAQKATLEVFDAQGRNVLSQKLENTSKIAVSNLKSGLYLYRITANGQTQNGKFVKE